MGREGSGWVHGWREYINTAIKLGNEVEKNNV